MNIDIYTCLASTSIPFAENLKNNLDSLQSGENTLRYWTVGNLKFGHQDVPGWLNVFDVNVDLPPSASHATALNSIIDFIPKDSDFVLIADCDVMILQKDWDKLILEGLGNDDCLGTPKFCNVLSVYFTIFKTNTYRKLIPNFMPGNEKTLSVPWYKLTNKKEASYYKMKVGDKLVQDTGWRIPAQLHMKGFTYNMFPYKQQYNNTNGLAFNYTLNNKLFITHYSGSHKNSYDGEKCKIWRNGANEFINQAKI